VAWGVSANQQKSRWQHAFGLEEPQLVAAFEALDADSIALFQSVSARIGYVKFQEYPVETYKRVARLALFDLFSDRPDDFKAAKMNMKIEDVAGWRTHPMYPLMVDEVKAAMKGELEDARATAEVLREDATRAAKTLRNASRYSTGKRDKLNAARDLVDRADPKVQKREEKHVLALDEGTIAQLHAALGTLRTAGHLPSGEAKALEAGDTIDAEVVP
jgi:hypothetical protein